MVESRACMSDHRPQKKWDARENLCSKTYGQWLFWLSTVLIEYVMLCLLTTVLLPVDLHEHLLLHLHLVFFVQVVKPWVGFPQVALDEVKLKGQTSWHESAVVNKTQHAVGMEWYQNLLVEQYLFNNSMVQYLLQYFWPFCFLGMRKPVMNPSCPQWHEDTFFTALPQNWQYHYIPTQQEKISVFWMLYTHLLGLWREGLGINFEERKLITVVVVHPFTEVVANIKASAGRRESNS